MELPGTFDGNRFFCSDAGATISPFSGMGREFGREFAFPKFSHFHVGGIWSSPATQLSLDLFDALCFLDRQELFVSPTSLELAGIYSERSNWTDSRYCHNYSGDRVSCLPSDNCNRHVGYDPGKWRGSAAFW